MSLFISRALSPAKVSSITIDEDNNRAEVFLKPDQVSLAIGRGGTNLRLAGSISGYVIVVYWVVVDSEVVALTEFVDEIDGWIIDELKNIGCDTAKSVLELSANELVKRTDLEEETIREIQSVLKSEFED